MTNPSSPRMATTKRASRNEFRRFAEAWAKKLVAATGPRAGPRSADAQVDRRDVGGLGFGVEELALREPQGTGKEDVREDLDGGVVVEDRRVVVLAAEGDLVLGCRQLLLELEDVLVRLELGVVLDDREQRPKGARQRVLGGGLLGWTLRPCGNRRGARVGDVGQ